MKAYLDLLRHVMENGEDRTERTGVGTRSVFGYQMRVDLKDGFPLLTSLTAGELVISFGDLHIYKNHFDQVKLQLERYPNQLPGLTVNREVKDINSFKLEDFSVYGYVPYPAIPAPIAV